MIIVRHQLILRSIISDDDGEKGMGEAIIPMIIAESFDGGLLNLVIETSRKLEQALREEWQKRLLGEEKTDA